jgi:hypothetical protein
MGDVIKVVEKLFERNRFDYNLADSDSDLPEGNDDSSTSGDESDSEAEDEDHIRSTKHSKKKKHNSWYSSNSDSEPEAPAQPAHKALKTTSKATILKEVSSKKQATDKHSGQDDVEQLIKQLGKLSLDDPKYGLLYYRAIKMDTAVAQCIPPPATARVAVRNSNAFRPPFPNQSAPPQPILSQSKASTMPPLDARPPMMCYGCGNVGHGMHNCPALQEMLQNGTLKRDQGGRITFQDGSTVH